MLRLFSVAQRPVVLNLGRITLRIISSMSSETNCREVPVFERLWTFDGSQQPLLLRLYCQLRCFSCFQTATYRQFSHTLVDMSEEFGGGGGGRGVEGRYQSRSTRCGSWCRKPKILAGFFEYMCFFETHRMHGEFPSIATVEQYSPYSEKNQENCR